MTTDHTDQVLEAWREVRPDIDMAPAGVVNRILRLAKLYEGELDEVVTEHGLSTKGDFDTLAALRRHRPNHELSPTQLAEAALITTGGMTARLDRLEERGYVARRSDPTDRRALLVVLTESGRRVVDDVLESSAQRHRRFVAPLDDGERTMLASLLRRLLISQERG